VIAPIPPQPIPKSNAAPGLLAYIVIAKFLDGLPLYRLTKIFARIGFDLGRGTSCGTRLRHDGQLDDQDGRADRAVDQPDE